MNELNDAAHRAHALVTERIDAMLERAEREADAIRRDAERYAEDLRRDAITSAERLLGRLQALEFPLGQLVVGIRDEMQRVTREIDSGAPVDSDGTELPAGAENVRGVPSAAGATAPRRSVEPPRDPAGGGPAAPDPPVAAAAPSRPVPPVEGAARGGWRGRRRSKAPATAEFTAVDGACAICQRSFEARTAAELADGGWKVHGDVGLCPSCQEDRWQLPDGARLPFRRGAVG